MCMDTKDSEDRAASIFTFKVVIFVPKHITIRYHNPEDHDLNYLHSKAIYKCGIGPLFSCGGVGVFEPLFEVSSQDQDLTVPMIKGSSQDQHLSVLSHRVLQFVTKYLY
jgi:hypothetical protein